MPDRSCLVIDDSQAAAARLSPLGREVLQQSTSGIRDAVISFASRRSWSIARYASFAGWASDQLRLHEGPCVVLDPLFETQVDTDRIHRVRLSRQFSDTAALRLVMADGTLPEVLGSRNLLIADDAAASGTTLRRMLGLVAEAGGSVGTILLCASSDGARRAIPAMSPTTRWQAYLPGDWRVVHLRDGCPFLPFSGRPVGDALVLNGGATVVERRVPSSAVTGNLWQVLLMDRGVKEAIEQGRRSILSLLRSALGRDPRVKDVPLLGADVPVLVADAGALDPETSLEDLLERRY